MHLFCQLSNLLGFFPVIYCIQNGDYELAVMVATCFIFSIFYHLNEKNQLGLFVDIVGCGILSGALFYTLKKSVQDGSDLTVANILTFCFWLFSFTCYIIGTELPTDSKDYAFYHSCWHILTVYGLSTFLYSFFKDKEQSKFLCVRIVKRGKRGGPNHKGVDQVVHGVLGKVVYRDRTLSGSLCDVPLSPHTDERSEPVKAVVGQKGEALTSTGCVDFGNDSLLQKPKKVVYI